MVQDPIAPGSIELARRQADETIAEADRLRQTEQWDRMLELSATAYRLSEQSGYRRGMASALGIRAFVHYMRSSLQQAIEDSMQALTMCDGDLIVEGRVRGILSVVHWTLGNYDEMLREGQIAMEYLRGSATVIDEAFGWISRGGMFHDMGDYESALQSSEHAIQMLSPESNGVALGRAYAQLGAAHLGLGDPQKALECHRRSLELGKEFGNQLLISRAINDIGEAQFQMGDDDAAETSFREALDIRTRHNYTGAAITSLLDLARLYLKRRDYDRAKDTALRAESSAREIGTRPKLAEASRLLSEIAEGSGDFAEALRSLKTYQQLREQIAGEQSQLRVKAMRLSSQLETLRAEQASTVNAEKMLAVGSLVGALAHEMNSPLGVIHSSTDTVLRATSKLGETPVAAILIANASSMAEAAKRLELTMNRLRHFAGIDLAEFREADLSEGVEEALAILSPELGTRISVSRDLQPLPPISCYAAELNQVFLNLLRNAIESITGTGEIRVVSRLAKRQIRIAFADSGRGIAPEAIPKLFNAGFNKAGKHVRAAMSLFTCLNIVQKHQGSIEVESKLGQGSTFTICLPAPS